MNETGKLIAMLAIVLVPLIAFMVILILGLAGVI